MSGQKATGGRVEILIDSQTFDNIDKAREVSRTALALDPNALETRRARGYIFEATGDYENAVQFYRSAIELNPNLAILHMELGRFSVLEECLGFVCQRFR